MKHLFYALVTLLFVSTAMATDNYSEQNLRDGSLYAQVSFRSNQKLKNEQGEYLYLYTNRTYSLDASSTIGRTLNGTYKLLNNNETIVLYYTENGETVELSGHISMSGTRVNTVRILGYTFYHTH
ncbi:MAG: hypothetical protein IKY68_04950 [Alistipes sp.]|nr:hypothetical protein [Alistipes sp.]